MTFYYLSDEKKTRNSALAGLATVARKASFRKKKRKSKTTNLEDNNDDDGGFMQSESLRDINKKNDASTTNSVNSISTADINESNTNSITRKKKKKKAKDVSKSDSTSDTSKAAMTTINVSETRQNQVTSVNESTFTNQNVKTSTQTYLTDSSFVSSQQSINNLSAPITKENQSAQILRKSQAIPGSDKIKKKKRPASQPVGMTATSSGKSRPVSTQEELSSFGSQQEHYPQLAPVCSTPRAKKKKSKRSSMSDVSVNDVPPQISMSEQTLQKENPTEHPARYYPGDTQRDHSPQAHQNNTSFRNTYTGSQTLQVPQQHNMLDYSDPNPTVQRVGTQFSPSQPGFSSFKSSPQIKRQNDQQTGVIKTEAKVLKKNKSSKSKQINNNSNLSSSGQIAVMTSASTMVNGPFLIQSNSSPMDSEPKSPTAQWVAAHSTGRGTDISQKNQSFDNENLQNELLSKSLLESKHSSMGLQQGDVKHVKNNSEFSSTSTLVENSTDNIDVLGIDVIEQECVRIDKNSQVTGPVQSHTDRYTQELLKKDFVRKDQNSQVTGPVQSHTDRYTQELLREDFVRKDQNFQLAGPVQCHSDRYTQELFKEDVVRKDQNSQVTGPVQSHTDRYTQELLKEDFVRKDQNFQLAGPVQSHSDRYTQELFKEDVVRKDQNSQVTGPVQSHTDRYTQELLREDFVRKDHNSQVAGPVQSHSDRYTQELLKEDVVRKDQNSQVTGPVQSHTDRYTQELLREDFVRKDHNSQVTDPVQSHTDRYTQELLKEDVVRKDQNSQVTGPVQSHTDRYTQELLREDFVRKDQNSQVTGPVQSHTDRYTQELLKEDFVRKDHNSQVTGPVQSHTDRYTQELLKEDVVRKDQNSQLTGPVQSHSDRYTQELLRENKQSNKNTTENLPNMVAEVEQEKCLAMESQTNYNTNVRSSVDLKSKPSALSEVHSRTGPLIATVKPANIKVSSAAAAVQGVPHDDNNIPFMGDTTLELSSSESMTSLKSQRRVHFDENSVQVVTVPAREPQSSDSDGTVTEESDESSSELDTSEEGEDTVTTLADKDQQSNVNLQATAAVLDVKKGTKVICPLAVKSQQTRILHLKEEMHNELLSRRH